MPARSGDTHVTGRPEHRRALPLGDEHDLGARREAAERLEAVAQRARHAGAGRDEEEPALVRAPRDLVEQVARHLLAGLGLADEALGEERVDEPAERHRLELERAHAGSGGPRRRAPSSTPQSASSCVPSVGNVAAPSRSSGRSAASRARQGSRALERGADAALQHRGADRVGLGEEHAEAALGLGGEQVRRAERAADVERAATRPRLDELGLRGARAEVAEAVELERAPARRCGRSARPCGSRCG